LVIHTDAVLSTKPDEAATETLLNEWHTHAQACNVHFFPAASDDTSESGPKGEILSAELGAVQRLTQLGNIYAAKGDTSKALRLYCRSLQEAELLKYLDYDSLRLAAGCQRRSLTFLKSLHLDQSQKTEAAALLRHFFESEPSLGTMDRSIMTAYTENQIAAGQAGLVWSERAFQVNLARPSNETADRRADRIVGAVGKPEIVKRLRMSHFVFEMLQQSVLDEIDQLKA
jgi:hypothetical protein